MLSHTVNTLTFVDAETENRNKSYIKVKLQREQNTYVTSFSVDAKPADLSNGEVSTLRLPMVVVTPDIHSPTTPTLFKLIVKCPTQDLPLST